jgi:uncharacterized HAD superfamily protein
VANQAFKIGFDFDDVLVASAAKTIELHNTQYGTALTVNDWYNPDVSPWGVATFAEVVTRVVEIQSLESFRTVEPLQKAHETLLQLKQAGHTVLVITGRPTQLKAHTAWLLQSLYGDVFQPDDVYYTDHFAFEGARIDKGDVAVQLQLTHFVDDVIQHANSVAAKGVKTILFSDNYMWNQAEADEGIVRLNNWDEIAEYFNAERE